MCLSLLFTAQTQKGNHSYSIRSPQKQDNHAGNVVAHASAPRRARKWSSSSKVPTFTAEPAPTESSALAAGRREINNTNTNEKQAGKNVPETPLLYVNNRGVFVSGSYRSTFSTLNVKLLAAPKKLCPQRYVYNPSSSWHRGTNTNINAMRNRHVAATVSTLKQCGWPSFSTGPFSGHTHKRVLSSCECQPSPCREPHAQGRLDCQLTPVQPRHAGSMVCYRPE